MASTSAGRNIALRDIAVKDINSPQEDTLQAIDLSALGVGIPAGYTQPVPTVGQNVMAIRERRSWTQTDLADRLQMRQPSVWKLEHSGGLPKAATLFKLAVALECSVEELLAGVNDGYDKLLDDLLGHGRVTVKGKTALSVEARVKELEGRLKAYEGIITRAHKLGIEIGSITVIDEDGGEVVRPTAKRGRRH